MTKHTRRAAAIPVAILLVLTSLGTALGVHPCAHHDLAPASGDAAGAGPAGSRGQSSGHEHDPGPGSEAHGPCTCVGQCQTGAAPSMPAPAVGRDLPTPPAAPQALLPAPPLPRTSIVPFSLPWGNAPPTL
jgi:hypothetical protein